MTLLAIHLIINVLASVQHYQQDRVLLIIIVSQAFMYWLICLNDAQWQVPVHLSKTANSMYVGATMSSNIAVALNFTQSLEAQNVLKILVNILIIMILLVAKYRWLLHILTYCPRRHFCVLAPLIHNMNRLQSLIP